MGHKVIKNKYHEGNKCQGMWCWVDYPVRPRGNPQPLGILLLIYSNAY